MLSQLSRVAVSEGKRFVAGGTLMSSQSVYQTDQANRPSFD